MKKIIDEIKENVSCFSGDDQKDVIESISSEVGRDSKEDKERISNVLFLMMNGNESVSCKNCGAVAFLDDEELEAFKNGKLACGQCNEILKGK